MYTLFRILFLGCAYQCWHNEAEHDIWCLPHAFVKEMPRGIGINESTCAYNYIHDQLGLNQYVDFQLLYTKYNTHQQTKCLTTSSTFVPLDTDTFSDSFFEMYRCVTIIPKYIGIGPHILYCQNETKAQIRSMICDDGKMVHPWCADVQNPFAAIHEWNHPFENYYPPINYWL